MFLAPWALVYLVFFYFLSFLLFYKGKKVFGLIVFFIGCSWQYHFGFMISSSYLLILILFSFFKNKKDAYNYFPPGLRTNKKSLLLIVIGFLPTVAMLINQFLLSFFGLSIYQGNSSVLKRIGIDSVNNIHHGGLLGVFQYLGGNRITLCINNLGQSKELFKFLPGKIEFYNCLITISGQIILSIISIILFAYIFKHNFSNRWVFFPLFFSFFAFSFIFQQTMAAHLLGYSFIFAGLFSIGFGVGMFKFSNKFISI